MRIFYLLLVLGSCFSTTLLAQEDVPRYPVQLSGYRDMKYTKASKVHCKKYNYFEIMQEWDKYYDYSKDSLNLTIKAPWGEQYIKYNLDGTLAFFSSPINNANETYTYTDDGKILKVESKSNNGENIGYDLYSYNNSTVTKTGYIYSKVYNKFFPIDKAVLEYCRNYNKLTVYKYNIDADKWDKWDGGYSIYKLDSDGRIVENGQYDEKGNYNFMAQYSYTNDGYTEIGNYLGNTYRKMVYTFNDQDDLIKELWYEGTDLSNLTLISTTEYTYTYSSPTFNERIGQNNYKIYSNDGSLVIENNTGINKKASIFTITGQLLRTISVSANRTEILLNTGIYIVVVDNQSYKVKVK